MQALIASEVICSAALFVGLLGMLTLDSRHKSTRVLLICCFFGIFWNLIDVASYVIDGCGIPDALAYFILFLSYITGGFCYIIFGHYCHLITLEKTTVRKWVFFLPSCAMFAGMVWLSVLIFQGKEFSVSNGNITILSPVPLECSILNIILLLYYPIVLFILRKKVGRRTAFLLGLYGLFPIITIAMMLAGFSEGYDYTPVGASFSILMVCTLLQNGITSTREREYRTFIEKNNEALLITNEKQELQLEEIKELNRKLSEYNDIVANAGYGVWHIILKAGEEPRMQVNEKMAELLSIDAGSMTEEKIYSSWYDRVSAEAIPSVTESVSEMISGKFSENTYVWNHPDKGEVYVRCGGTAVTLEDGTSILSGYHADVTELVLKEQKYKEELKDAKILAEAHNSELAEQLGIINSLAKSFNSLYYINLNDYSFVELGSSGPDIQNVIGEKGDARAAFKRMYERLVVSEYVEKVREFTYLDSLKERLMDREWISFRFLSHAGGWREGVFIVVSRDEAGICNYVIWGTRDIDEEKKRELSYQEALEKATAEAEAANEAKTAFLFNMSHDIRTPMNAIIGYTDLLEKNYGNTEKYLDYMSKIRSSSDFLLSLINNVLEMARIESGKITVENKPCNSLAIFNNVKDVYSELMKGKNIEFIPISEVKTPYIYCDVVKLNQIFLNLISNAYKYTPEGGQIKMSLVELPGDKPGFINIQTIVSDTGIGMSPDYLPILFDEFSRERNATEGKIQGTGLGMPIVKKLVTILGGTITVESEPDKGTTFVVTIPHQIADGPGQSSENTETDNVECFIGKHILLAEDNELNAEIATAILEDLGFKVECAYDGVMCLDMLKKAPAGYYDLILMDIQMPGMDGYRATRLIREMEDPRINSIPIVAMTANAFAKDQKDAMEAGMNGHLAKPIEVPKLIYTLSELLQDL